MDFNRDDTAVVFIDPQWGDGYQAALINLSFLAHAVLWTDELLAQLPATQEG